MDQVVILSIMQISTLSRLINSTQSLVCCDIFHVQRWFFSQHANLPQIWAIKKKRKRNKRKQIKYAKHKMLKQRKKKLHCDMCLR